MTEPTDENGDGSDDASSDEDDDEWDEMQKRDWIDLPFELRCVDAVLQSVGELLAEDTLELQEVASSYIERLCKAKGLADDPLTIIRVVKDAVREMSSRVKGFVESLERTLDEDEDMALMNLSRLLTNPERFIQPVSPAVLEEESDEPELILEAHLQVGLSLTNALDLIQGQIDTAAELVDQQLDAMRNRILFANMILTVVAVCLTSASLVGSLLGMNLLNYLEEDPTAFRQVVSGTLGGTVFLGLLILVVLYLTGTVPHMGITMGGGGDPLL
jgi:magnesium transporter